MRNMKIVTSFDELIKALDLKPGETIEFTGSKHHRDHKIEIDFVPQSKDELKAIIETASRENLLKMGVGIWTTYDDQQGEKKCRHKDSYDYKPGDVHYLFPGEWYNHIPNGFDVIDINGVKEKFITNKTDNDIRYGCLSFGFVRNE